MFVQNYLVGIIDISQLDRQLWKLFVPFYSIQGMNKKMLVIV